MRYGSVCSGVEAASLAWEPLGWTPAWFAEIEPFPSAVLAHRWPDVPNLGDFTKIRKKNHGAIDVLVGGTPCQSFSVAGKRAGMDDPRGLLTLEFLRLAGRLRPRWIVWENVRDVLSSGGTKDFGTVLGALGELGYGFAYRVLDAQFFGVAQRRRRVFLVGCSGGDWRRAAAVLFEREGLRGDSAPGGKAGEVAPTLPSRSTGGGGLGSDFDYGGGAVMQCHGGNVGPMGALRRGNGSLTGGVPFIADTILANAGRTNASAGNNPRPKNLIVTHDVAPCLQERGGKGPDSDCTAALVMSENQRETRVRRLTPRECERLQGMPDDHTRIPWRGRPEERCPDGPRYRAIGNSMAVPVMAWIGRRIGMAEGIERRKDAS